MNLRGLFEALLFATCTTSVRVSLPIVTCKVVQAGVALAAFDARKDAILQRVGCLQCKQKCNCILHRVGCV